MNKIVRDLESGSIFHEVRNSLSFVLGKLTYSGNGFSPLLIFLLFVGLIIFCIFVLFIIRVLLSIKRSLQQPSVILELTPPAMTEKSAYTTQQFFSTIFDLRKQKSVADKFLGRKRYFSFEIVSTKKQGIRYIVRASKDDARNIKHHLFSYLPQVRVKEVEDYLSSDFNNDKMKVVELKLTKHFAYPLQKQINLVEHDPVAYITGMMTKLKSDELMSFQMVLSPSRMKQKKVIKNMILRGEDVLTYLDARHAPQFLGILLIPFKILLKILTVFISALKMIVNDFIDARGAQRQQQLQYVQQYGVESVVNKTRPARVLTPSEQLAVQSVEQKIDQRLFQTKIRLLILMRDKATIKEREVGFLSSFAFFSGANDQLLKRKYNFSFELYRNYLLFSFKNRLLSLVNNSSPMLLSVSEVSDLYHFPFTQVTKTENIVKSQSRDLPAPLSLKNERKMNVVFGKNTYGGTETPIGLTEEERETHMYIIGRTGSGKTTMMYSMAKHDIENGSGLAFIDPHGDVSDDLVASIPENRMNDLIFINPIDLKYPIGINLLELTPGLEEDEAELEKEVVAEGVISLFRKVFSKEENTNAHRIEYILRNTIYTAFTIEGRTIFTIYDLLNNPDFRKNAIKGLTDENLVNFWKFEFGKAGDFQVVKMAGGVTAKIGRFLFSPTAKRILEQPKSTIDFYDIINSGKILICNLSQGKLGEDTSRILGITILTKLQQAALKRANIKEKDRKAFYLYVDEFQNFATQSFTKLLSEGRKYKLRVVVAEQSTSQQDDPRIINIILANVTTVVVFRSANPIDEELMLSQLAPSIERGDISNLPRYHFYIKVSAIDSEEPFSGETIYMPVEKDQKKIDQLIQASRDNHAIVYKKPESKPVLPTVKTQFKGKYKSAKKNVNTL